MSRDGAPSNVLAQEGRNVGNGIGVSLDGTVNRPFTPHLQA